MHLTQNKTRWLLKCQWFSFYNVVSHLDPNLSLAGFQGLYAAQRKDNVKDGMEIDGPLYFTFPGIFYSSVLPVLTYIDI